MADDITPADAKDAIASQCVLMLTVALDELRATEAEADLAKVRIKIASVENTLKELLELANKATKPQRRLGL